MSIAPCTAADGRTRPRAPTRRDAPSAEIRDGRARCELIAWTARERAVEQYGYVTTRDAADAGVPAVELRKLAHRGFLERTGRGLYRFPDVPVNERTEYMEAVLWAGEGAALSHDAVLALHDLGFANPSTIRVTVPRRVRKTHPRHDITLVQADLPDEDLTTYEGIPSTTVARALLDVRGLLMTSRLHEAAVTARDQGLVLADEYDRVLTALRDA